MVPTAAVADVIADCAEAGIKVASVYSDGFAETGPEGLRCQTDLVATARKVANAPVCTGVKRWVLVPSPTWPKTL